MKTNKGKSSPDAKMKTATCKDCGKPWHDHLARRRGYIEINFKGPKPPGPRSWRLPKELLRDIALVVAKHFAVAPKAAIEVRGLERIRDLERKREFSWTFGDCWRG